MNSLSLHKSVRLELFWGIIEKKSSSDNDCAVTDLGGG